MRIAVLSTDPGVAWGGTKGASVHLEQLAVALAGEGAEVLVLAARVEARASAGIAVEQLPGPGKRSSADERLAAEPWRTEWLERRLKRFGAAALYERFALHTRAGSAAAQCLGIPHLVELNSPLRAEAARYRRLERREVALRLEGCVLERSALVIAVSEPLAEYARGRGAPRTAVLPNAVALDALRDRAHRVPTAPVAVLAGTLRPWHGPETVAAAWRYLGAAAPPLLVIGDGAGCNLLAEAGAGVTGPVPHRYVPSLLAGCDIGLVPYAADAPGYFSPLKLFEYLAARLAVVAAALPGVTEVVGPATAVLVPPGDARALGDAVAALAADPDERRRLGDSGYELVKARHTWEQRARDVLAAAAPLGSLEVIAP